MPALLRAGSSCSKACCRQQAPGQAGSTKGPPVAAFFVMQKLQRFRQRVEKAKRAEFDAAAATRAAEEELISEEVDSGLKRRRVEPDETDANFKSWARSDWLRQETWTQNRRAEPLRAGVTVLPPRDGEHGYLHHWRRGGVGWVRDWARGDISGTSGGAHTRRRPSRAAGHGPYHICLACRHRQRLSLSMRVTTCK